MDRENLQHWVSASLKIGIVLALVYVGVDYLRRMSLAPIVSKQQKARDLHADLYVHPPKSYVTSPSRAKKLIGMPLWVKEGYRWPVEPGGTTLKPLQRIVPTAVRQREGETLLVFEENGRDREVAVGQGASIWVDDIFFIRDPKELFDHWSAEDWERVERREVEAGMSEYQVVFALGAGETVESSRSTSRRVVEYRARQTVGLPGMRVVFRDFIAEEVSELPTEP